MNEKITAKLSLMLEATAERRKKKEPNTCPAL